jgi:hypothetical protein
MGCVMRDQGFANVRELSRENLEDLAIRAVLQLQAERRETAPNSYFMAVLSGFMIGTLVAGAGFLIGAGLR